MPTRSGVEGLQFSQMKISDDRVIAFAPARLTKVEPDCGPITGSTRLVVTGNGVFEADRIMVSFSFDLGDGLSVSPPLSSPPLPIIDCIRKFWFHER